VPDLKNHSRPLDQMWPTSKTRLVNNETVYDAWLVAVATARELLAVLANDGQGTFAATVLGHLAQLMLSHVSYSRRVR